MALNDAAKEEAKNIKAAEALRKQQEKDGWYESEWGEWCPPVNEVSTKDVVKKENQTPETTPDQVSAPEPGQTEGGDDDEGDSDEE